MIVDVKRLPLQILKTYKEIWEYASNERDLPRAGLDRSGREANFPGDGVGTPIVAINSAAAA